MNCRVYLVRHGETVWNAEMRFQGHSDISLTDQGKLQASALGKRLQREQFSSFYASDLGRAFETASIIASHHKLEVHQEPAFREINFGNWEGLTFEQIKEQYAEAAAKWWKEPFTNQVPGGESLEEVVERSMMALQKICQRHKGQNILIATHGGVIRSIICQVLGIDLNEYWRLRQDNMALNIIYFPSWDKGILELFNDCSHLKK